MQLIPRALIFIWTIIIALVFVPPTLAVNFITGGDAPTLNQLETVFGNVIFASVSLAGIALLFTLISGGFKWATSSGDPKKLQSAQNTLGFGIVGFILLLSSVLILMLIREITGVDVLNFTIIQ
jgi:hypothetical protein